MRNDGLGRFFYEFAFHQLIEGHKERTGKPVMISQARHLRDRLGHALANPAFTGEGLPPLTMDDTIPIPSFMSVVDEVLKDGIAGYESPFTEYTGADATYAKLRADMCNMVGMNYTAADGTLTKPVPGVLGVRLPISPYDPRFAGRSSVRAAGSELSYITDDDLEAAVDGSPARVEDSRAPGLRVHAIDPRSDAPRLRSNGPMVSMADLAGLTELSSRMTRAEMRSVRDWVINGAQSNGTFDTSKFMSTDAVLRAAAVLDHLRNEGVEYTVSTGRHPGEVTARLEGTGIQVTLMAQSDREHFVGSIYDNGAQTYLMTTEQNSANGVREHMLNPTAQDCINLVDIARGKPVKRLDSEKMVGEPDTYENARGARVNASYRTDVGFASVYGDVPGSPGHKVLIQRRTNNRTSVESFLSESGGERAEAVLRGAISSARARFIEELDGMRIINDAIAYAGLDEEAKREYVVDYSVDPLVAGFQREYWDVLTGRSENLVRPGADHEAYDDLINGDIDMSMATPGERRDYDEMKRRLTYSGTQVEQVLAHMANVEDAVIGQYEPHNVRDVNGVMQERRFDPSYVAKYMTSADGLRSNEELLVNAMRRMDIKADELMGSDFTVRTMADRLINFNAESAVDMETSDSEFMRKMGSHIRESLKINGVDVTTIKIDDQGLVEYEGSRARTLTAGREKNVFVGHIGQIWEPDEMGAVRTKFGGTENFMYVPGYEASVLPQVPGENKTLEERTRLRGYEQAMLDEISYRIGQDVLEGNKRSELGTATSLNRVHRSLYAERHPVDFVERAAEAGLSNEWIEARLKTEAGRVRYDSKFADGSTIVADYAARNNYVDMSDDNSADPWVLTGGRNMSVLAEEGDRFFDPIATGTAKNQGIVRFLNESTSVNVDGTMNPGVEGDRCPIMKVEGMKYMDFNPFDRQQMTVSNVMKAESVVEQVKTSQMVFRNWTLQDGMVVSKEFAEANMITGSDGERRPLTQGDKLSDLNGNKGVIGLVVDRTMTPEVAREKDLEAEVALFKENPELEVVMSPFSAISRHNGGSARELMSNPSDFVHNGQVLPGHVGESTLLVTHKAADKVTNIYGEDEVRAGKGRKVSGQYGWILEDKGCDAIFTELYGNNTGSVVALREYLNVVGMDLTPDGNLRVGREDHTDDDARKVFSVPDEIPFTGDPTKARPINLKSLQADFARQIASSGGVLELPWPLTFPNGEQLPTHTDSSWELPIMSVSLRTGQEFLDGRLMVHDYTKHYTRIFSEAANYKYAQQRLEEPDLSDSLREKYERISETSQNRAQTYFASLTSTVIDRQFEGKHNIVREKIMSHRVPNSATAILTPDPRIGLHQVGMNEVMLEALGVSEGQRVLVHRDPMIHNGGLRYMEVVKDNDIEGVSLNPAAAKSFEGDFDGDTLGIIAIKTKSAQKEAMIAFSPESNMLDLSVERNERGQHPLFYDMSCDVAVAMHSNPEFVESLIDVETELNQIEKDLASGVSDMRDAMERRSDMMGELNEVYSNMANSQIATAMISYESPQAHMESVARACIDTGAKGDERKLLEYAEYVGFEHNETDNRVPGTNRHAYTYSDAGHTLHTREQDRGSQYATAVKAIGTAMTGTLSQMAVREIRNVDVTQLAPTSTAPLSVSALQAANNMMSKGSQSMLQAKKDPVDAYRRFQLSKGPLPALMQGARLEPITLPDGTDSFRVQRDEKGQMIKADRDVWVKQATLMFNDKRYLGVGVNPEMIERVADGLTKADGTIRGFEPEKTNEAQLSTASTMDRLAYAGGFEQWKEAAEAGKNLFEGRGNSKLAPVSIKKNIEVARQISEAFEMGQPLPDVTVTAISPKDVRPAPNEPRSAATLNGSGIAVLSPEVPSWVAAEVGKDEMSKGGVATLVRPEVEKEVEPKARVSMEEIVAQAQAHNNGSRPSVERTNDGLTLG